ncbi:hypothetical protein Droror1_Dr00012000 [Drosera rotundifolia]
MGSILYEGTEVRNGASSMVRNLFDAYSRNLQNADDEEFGKFKDGKGKFMTSLRNDIHGLQNLYEAAYYAFEVEFLLDEATAFAQKDLIKLKDVVEDRSVADWIACTLDLPLQS